jgi:hypothetical protein
MVRVRRTPGRLSLIMVALVVLGLGTGVTGVLGVQDRANLVAGVTAHSGALAVAAQDLYRSLSDADATAASAFLSNGLEPPALRERYQADIAKATAALTVAAGGSITRGPGAAAIAKITAALPIYTGLVETGRAYNRQGLPVGVAYLREASGLMRMTLLPAAQALYQAVSRRLADARRAAGAFPWAVVPLGLLTLAGLVLAQVYLTRRTNRLFNVGLVAATAAGLVAVVWLGFASIRTAEHLEASRRHGSAQVDLLAEARIAALQARGDEALTLVARGSGTAFEQDYTAVMERLIGKDGSGGLLGRTRAEATDSTTRRAVDSAIANASGWLSVHKRLRALDDEGRYTDAVALAIGLGPDSAAGVFNRLDEDLVRAIARNHDRFDREVGRAGTALAGAGVGLAILTLLLVMGVVAGIEQRMAEYR